MPHPVLSRRRDRRVHSADTMLRQSFGDVNIVGFWDTRFPWTITHSSNAVSEWADARGNSGYGPALVQATAAAKPTYDMGAATITFDGTDDFLRSTDAAWNTITAGCSLIYVGTLPTTGGGEERMVELSTSAGNSVLFQRRAASNGDYEVVVIGITTAAVTSVSGRRVFHARRSAASGGNVTVGARIGNDAETTQTGAGSDATANRITLGASRADSPAGFANLIVRSLLVIKGEVNAGQQVVVTEWARSVHAASV